MAVYTRMIKLEVVDEISSKVFKRGLSKVAETAVWIWMGIILVLLTVSLYTCKNYGVCFIDDSRHIHGAQND